MSLSIKVSLKSDDKVWKRMAKNLSRGGQKTATVGWWNSVHPTGIPVAQVAQLNEEGHENGAGSAYPGTITPARPFIRLGFLPKVGKVLPSFTSQAHAVAMGAKTWTQVNHEMGWQLKGILQDVIEAWSTPPNRPATIALKGRNDPLVDSGTMLDTVQTKVIRKGGSV